MTTVATPARYFFATNAALKRRSTRTRRTKIPPGSRINPTVSRASALLPCPNGVPLKLNDLAEVGHDKLRTVSAGIDMELVRNAARGQQLIQHLRALLEAETLDTIDAYAAAGLPAPVEAADTVGAHLEPAQLESSK